MISKNLMESTILNFMNLVLSVNNIIKKPYLMGWREPGYNFYVKKYSIVSRKNVLWIYWVNLNEEENVLRFLKPKYKSNFWNKLYFLFHKQISTTDKARTYNILTQVIFPDFCKELGIKTDFTVANTPREAADLVVCSLYGNFFKDIVPIDKFIDMFGLNNFLSVKSLNYIKCFDYSSL